MKQTDTPRTDQSAGYWAGPGTWVPSLDGYVPSSVAREMEREIATLKQEMATIKDYSRKDYVATQSRLVQARDYIEFLENKLGIGEHNDQ